MLRITFFPPDPESRPEPLRVCACCGGRYPVKRKGMRLFSAGRLVGDICPECVLAGPAGAAAKVRALAAGRRADAGAGSMEENRTSWDRRMEKKAQSLEGTSSFSLAARQAAVRETRERR